MKNKKANAARLAILPACLGIALCLILPVPSFAQDATVVSTLNPAFYAVPAGMKVSCATSASDETMSRTCPVIRCGVNTTWAYNFNDDRGSLGIVSYDASGKIVSNVTRDGARYVYKITSDTAAKTVTLWGQGDAPIVLPWPAVCPLPVYKWVARATPPANAVTAPDAPNKAVCKGTGEFGRLWAGYWDGTQCIGSYSGNRMPAGTNLQFLVLVSGQAQWLSGSPKILPCDIGALPANDINAGNTYSGLPQILCSQVGYVGWANQNKCAISAPFPLSCQQNATVLVGRVE